MGYLRFLGIHRRGTFSVLSGDGSVLREGVAEEAFSILHMIYGLFSFVRMFFVVGEKICAKDNSFIVKMILNDGAYHTIIL